MSRMALHSIRPKHPRTALPRRQTGAALLIIISMVAASLITTLLVFAAPSSNAISADRTTQESLAAARQALIGRAAADDNRPGSLPCPDTNDDGDAELFSGNDCESYIGRLPWRTLGLPDLRDAAGERLWYALAPSLRDHPSAPAPNSNSPGTAELTLTGTPAVTDLAAVVIAPGPALAGQDRATDRLDRTRYLEGENANGDNIYDGAALSASYNDTVAVITRQQLFSVVEQRVANHIRSSLERYFFSNGYYPYANEITAGNDDCTTDLRTGRVPDPTADLPCQFHGHWNAVVIAKPPSWFVDMGWHGLTFYAVSSNCTRLTPNCDSTDLNPPGNLQVNGVAGKRIVVVVGSRPLVSQVCPAGQPCLEQPQTGPYVQRSISTGSFNDRLATNP